MKIYTKTGDQGQTSLYSGNRVAKYHPRVETYGTVDELNAHLGLLRDWLPQQLNDLSVELLAQQNLLFALGAALADDRPDQGYELPTGAVADLETAIDRMNEGLPKMTHFILPGGHAAISQSHVCRTVCRRAERRLVELVEDTDVPADTVVYLNRLSDYLFVVGRFLHKQLGVAEIRWES